jgi:hypothetical protein
VVIDVSVTEQIIYLYDDIMYDKCTLKLNTMSAVQTKLIWGELYEGIEAVKNSPHKICRTLSNLYFHCTTHGQLLVHQAHSHVMTCNWPCSLVMPQTCFIWMAITEIEKVSTKTVTNKKNEVTFPCREEWLDMSLERSHSDACMHKKQSCTSSYASSFHKYLI